MCIIVLYPNELLNNAHHIRSDITPIDIHTSNTTHDIRSTTKNT